MRKEDVDLCLKKEDEGEMVMELEEELTYGEEE